MTGAAGRLADFPKLMARIIETKAWQHRVEPYGNEVRLPTLRDLITRNPIEGWGEKPETVEKLLHDHPKVLADFREAMKHQGERTDLPNNVREVGEAKCGNSRAYSIARVQRECDEEAVAAVMAGEISPNAALVKAGVRENRQVYIPRDPRAAVEKLRTQFGDDFVQAMKEAMDGRQLDQV